MKRIFLGLYQYKFPVLALAAVCLCWAAWPSSSDAYITGHPETLDWVVNASQYIFVVRVEKVSQEKGIIIYRKIRDLKGKFPKDEVKHVFANRDRPEQERGLFQPSAREWSYILQWAEPGKETVIMGVNQSFWGHYNHVYVDQCWYGAYCVKRGNMEGDLNWWDAIYCRPQILNQWYCGSAAQLPNIVSDILKRKEVVVPVAQFKGGKNDLRGLTSGRSFNGSADDLRLGRAKIMARKSKGQLLKGDWSDPNAAQAMEALLPQMKNPDVKIRLQTVRQLEQWFGPEIKTAVPVLISALQDENETVRKIAAEALKNRHSLDSCTAFVPALCNALKDKDRDVRIRAAKALGAWREEAKTAIPALTEALKDGDNQVVETAAAALFCIDADIEAKAPGMTELLQSKASCSGRYQKLLGRFKVSEDVGALPFQDQGATFGEMAAVANYQGHNLPRGYRVYAYPYWYVWGERVNK